MNSPGSLVRVAGGVATFCLALLLAACAAVKPSLRADYDRGTDFSSYGTYGYVDPVGTDKAGYSTLITQHFKQAVDAEMSARGYRQVTTNAELLVNFMAEVEEKVDVRTTPGSSVTAGLGYYRYRRGMSLGIGIPLYNVGSEVDSVRYKYGTASVELIDAGQRRIVWEGVAEGRLTRAVMENPQQAIVSVVKQLFEKYPGRAVGN